MAYQEVGAKPLAAVVIHGNAGLTDWVRSFPEQLAEKGSLVVAPDLLSSFAEKHKITSDFATGFFYFILAP